jgi:peptide/nickel transport system permease protein
MSEPRMPGTPAEPALPDEPGREISIQREGLSRHSYFHAVWYRFRKNKLGKFSGVVIIILIFVVMFAEFLSPNDHTVIEDQWSFHPPTRLHLVDSEGRFHLRPFVYGTDRVRNPTNLKLEYVDDTDVIYPVRLFVRSWEYKMLGVFRTRIHLFGIDAPEPIFPFGADGLGKCVFSRVLYGSRVSLSIAFGVVLAGTFIGMVLGGLAGYYGGIVDNLINRLGEFLISMPTLPLWLVMAAAIPNSWTPLQRYVAVLGILLFKNWPGWARVVRSKIISLRNEDYVKAAISYGAKDGRIIMKYLMPNVVSVIIVSITFGIPGVILGETALSFLGLGLTEPAVSWGVLLRAAQNFPAVVQNTWILIPGAFVVGTVLIFNFFGDAVRDAVDPYEKM